MDNRGVSNVVVAVLVVLISIVAVGIVWVAVVPLLQDSGEGVTAGCFKNDMYIKTCTYDDNFVSILVSRGGANGNVSGIQFVFDQQGDKTTLKSNDTAPVPFESKRYIFDKSVVPIPSYVQIVAILPGGKLCLPSNVKVSCGSGALNFAPQCSDNLDNDGDGLIDGNDPGCSDASDNDENNSILSDPQCSDNLDNDGDGATDLADFSCGDSNDLDEQYPLSLCQNGLDDDNDGWTDLVDPACGSNQTNTENLIGTTECSDQADSDGDGLVDGNDPGCSDASDNDESDGYWRKLNGGWPVDSGESFKSSYFYPYAVYRSLETLHDSAGNLIYYSLGQNPQNLYLGKLTTAKSWDIFTYGGWSNSQFQTPKPFSQNRYSISKIKMFSSPVSGDIIGTFVSVPSLSNHGIDIHDRAYSFTFDNQNVKYWSAQDGYNSNNITALSTSISGTPSFNHDSDINSNTILTMSTSCADGQCALTAARYKFQTGAWENWINNAWTKPTNFVEGNSTVALLPFAKYVASTGYPTVTALPGNQDFLVTYVGYNGATGKTSIRAALYQGGTGTWALWNNGWHTDFTTWTSGEIVPEEQISPYDRRTIIDNGRIYMFYRKSDAPFANGPLYIRYYNISSPAWSNEQQILPFTDNFALKKDSAGAIWLVYSNNNDLMISSFANGVISSPSKIYNLKANSRLMGLDFLGTNPVVFISELEGTTSRMYALGSKSGGYWDSETVRLPATNIDNVPLDSAYGEEVNQFNTHTWINVSYNGQTYSGGRDPYGTQLCGHMSLDSEHKLYCPKVGTNNLGIFPNGYNGTYAPNNENGRQWGGYWDYLYFPSGAAIDNIRGKVYLTDQIVEGTTFDGNISGQLQVWDKSWNTLNVVSDFTYSNFSRIFIPQLWFPEIYTKAETNHYLNWPSDAVVDESRGLLYVTETNANRVVVYNVASNPDNPTFARTIGSEGSGQGQLNHPEGIDLDSSGNLYVVDTRNNRIEVFDSNGNFVRSFGSLGKSPGQLIYPYSISVDKIKGYVYVTDSGNHKLQIFRLDGTFVYAFGEWAPKNPTYYSIRRFQKIGGVAAENNSVYVSADTDDDGASPKIIKFKMNLP